MQAGTAGLVDRDCEVRVVFRTGVAWSRRRARHPLHRRRLSRFHRSRRMACVRSSAEPWSA